MSVLASAIPRSSSANRLGPLGVCALAIGLLMLVPILVVAANVFGRGDEAWGYLVDTVLPGYIGNTLLLMVGVTCGVVSIGVLCAWLVTSYRFHGRRILEWALVLPMAMPAYVMAYAYTDWLDFAGPVQSALREWTGWRAHDYWFPEIRSLYGAAAMFSFALYPYVYLLARNAFLEQSRSAVEAGRLAGLSAWGSFLRVAVPLARPAIAAGTALALMETLADFGTVSYFAVQTFTTGIFRAWLSLGDVVAAAQLAACLLSFVLLLVMLERHSRGAARYHSQDQRKPVPTQRLRGARALIAFALCAAPVFFGFVLPTLILLKLAFAEPAAWSARVATLTFNSFTLAGVTAMIAVALAVLMAYAARITRSPMVVGANRLAGLGYAVPGAVIALGVLVPLGRADNAIALWAEHRFGIDTGLIFTGSIAALVYAYLVRYLAVSLHTVDAGLAKITPSMDDAARSLGYPPAKTLAHVHAPMLWGSLLSAALLVFVDVMKELPATFALRPFNFDTLAVEAYNLASDERLGEAAGPALLIVAVGLLPLIFLSRRITRAV